MWSFFRMMESVPRLLGVLPKTSSLCSASCGWPWMKQSSSQRLRLHPEALYPQRLLMWEEKAWVPHPNVKQFWIRTMVPVESVEISIRMSSQLNLFMVLSSFLPSTVWIPKAFLCKQPAYKSPSQNLLPREANLQRRLVHGQLTWICKLHLLLCHQRFKPYPVLSLERQREI